MLRVWNTMPSISATGESGIEDFGTLKRPAARKFRDLQNLKKKKISPLFALLIRISAKPSPSRSVTTTDMGFEVSGDQTWRNKKTQDRRDR